MDTPVSNPEPHQFVRPTKAPARRSPLTARKKAVFALVALLLPFALLLVTEGVLRLLGFGGYPTALKVLGPDPARPGVTFHITDNEGPRTWFIGNRERPGTLTDAMIAMPKPAGAVRIVAVGESAMKGFPQPPGLASTEFLREMLRDAWPDRPVEVINLGVTAVASFPVSSILDEALEREPDLVIVYVGNNEFFGAYGVLSLSRAGNTPSVMMAQRSVRSSALLQALSRLKPASAPREGETLMETMMGGRTFTAPDDPIRARAASNLGYFVGRMADNAKAKNVPIIVCTLPCNERDLAPLGDADQTIGDASKRTIVATTLAGIGSKIEADPAGARAELEKLAAEHPAHARVQWWLGRALEKLGEHDRAAKAFERSVDLDPMPWRPPSVNSDAARAAAEARGAIVCDLRAAFRASARSKGLAAPGWDLMDDHVHPTLLGQDLVARSIVESMSRCPEPARVTPEQAARVASFKTLAQRLGANDYERYGVAHQMRVLARIPFFKETNPWMLERFDGVCSALMSAWDPKIREVATEWQKPETHRGAKRPLSAMAGRVLIAQGKFPEALVAYEAAARSVFEYTSWSLEYEVFIIGCKERLQPGGLTEGDRARARAALARGQLLLVRAGPESGMTERHVGTLHIALGEDEKAVPYLNSARTKLREEARLACEVALVRALVKVGRVADARVIIEEGIRDSGRFAVQYQALKDQLMKAPGTPAPGSPAPASGGR